MSAGADATRALAEIVGEMLAWCIRLPNEQYAYTECRYCHGKWWGATPGRENPEPERHNRGCAVPRWYTDANALLRRLAAAPANKDDPGRCAKCGASFEWVRPGKSQATCECWAICSVHGAGKIAYHCEGEFPQVSGYFCADCEREAALGRARPEPEDG